MCEESTAPSSLRGKVALVTGGTGSIGWACAKQLAEAGCHVALVDLDLARCEELAAQLPTKSIGVAFDVSSEPAVVAGVPAAVRWAARRYSTCRSAGGHVASRTRTARHMRGAHTATRRE